ncbi:beta strand repeat-containing protein [Brevundimonas lenta]|uniref:Ca2+-binding RTX toxin-like protein n=1 Tax=Brevundimonas lenta TaxID=424796 RepID=A0A7W6JEQ4_9CAUL|nr:calcium-binding protein [Brevundimonas lenta]MBB4083751.1 Ca2+-binding RTX toxin-like protein [Brevundimonas lenta]
MPIINGTDAGEALKGTTGDDTIRGGGGPDSISGDAGNDVLYGDAGNDILNGDAGIDTLYGGAGSDELVVGAGDTAFGEDGYDAFTVLLNEITGVTLDGGAGHDTVNLDFALGAGVIYLDDAVGAGAHFSNIEVIKVGRYAATIYGGSRNDTITTGGASSGVRTYHGGGGDDVLSGGDFLYGDAGDDVLSGPNMDGGAGFDTAVLGFTEGLAIDLGLTTRQKSGTSSVVLVSIEGLVGGIGHDDFYGSSVANTLSGDSGDDRLEGGGGDDILKGGEGIDMAAYRRATSGVTVSLGEGAHATGATGVDTFDSIEGLIGSAFNDVLTGDAGNNQFEGGAGDDRIEGGAGFDVAIYNSSSSTAKYTYDGVHVTVTGAPFGTDVLTGVEMLMINGVGVHVSEMAIVSAGTAAADTIIGGNAGDTLRGGAGADLIQGGAGSDKLYGDDGDDRLEGGTENDVLDGGAGDDVIDGGSGSNQGFGGAGADWLFNVEDADGGAGDDRYLNVARITEAAGAGIDTLYWSQGSFTLPANVENLFLNWSAADTVFNSHWITVSGRTGTGNALNNRIVGTGGADTLIGNAGDDVLTGGAGDDILDGGAGVDTAIFDRARADYDIYLGPNGWTVGRMDDVNVVNGVELLRFTDGLFDMTGAPMPMAIEGTAGADVIMGTAGANAITAGAGDDLITGALGDDTIDGGAGVDTAVFSRAPATVTIAGGVVTVLNPDGRDVLTNIERLRFGADEIAVAALQLSNVIGSTAAETLTGTAATDGLFGLAGADMLNGLAGSDYLSGGAGVDILDGGEGSDTAVYALAASGVTARIDSQRATNDGDGGTDTFVSIEHLRGSNFADTLIGDARTNILLGGLGSDILLGLGGADVLGGGTGASNTLQGGLGDDLYVLEALDSVIEVAGEGNDTIEAHISAYNLANNVENLIYAGAGNFSGTGNALNNVMTGGGGDDLLRGRGGVDVLQGGAGIDTADYSQAAAGIHARLDTMRAVNDGDGSTDTFTGIEAILGSAFNDTLVGGTLGDRLSGGLGADTLLGFAGNDILAGGQGLANQLQGGLGDDTYILDAYDSIVEIAGQGHDVIEAHVGAHVMAANVEDMFYVGFNKFYGTGNAGANTITGGIGDDILKGMGGSDRLFGGAGLDEVQVRGAKAQYTVTAEGAGWRIVDTVAGRDGSIYVESIESLRFLTGNTKTVLTYGVAAAEAVSAKAFIDDAFVLPTTGDAAAPAPKTDTLFDVRPLPTDRLLPLTDVFHEAGAPHPWHADFVHPGDLDPWLA